MKLIRIIGLLIVCLSNTSNAQYFQFSQYNFTPQRINPAQVGNSDYAAISLDFRNQATGGGFHLNSNIVNVSYPIISKTGRRWSGVGISLMDDRSGEAGIFNSQEAGLSYALNVPVAVNQTFSLGFKGVYQNRKFDLGGLYTGSQYIPDRGFSESLTNGENIGQFISNYVTFSAGLYWQKTDKKGDKVAYWGISFFDFNKPSDSFLGLKNELNSTLVAALGFVAYNNGPLTFFPEVLFTRGSSNNVVNAGCITRYQLVPSNKIATHVDVITKYVLGRSGIIGLQFHRENISFGFSYDFPIIVKNVANTGAIEVGVELRRLVTPRKKNRSIVKKSSSQKQEQKTTLPRIVTAQKDSVEKTNEVDSFIVPLVQENKGAITHPQKDSIRAGGEAGTIHHEPLILEKGTLKFGFDFNSVSINEETSRYLDELAIALIDNPELGIQLIGHTDNVGSVKFNMRLSLYRAQKLKDYLVQKGVDAKRISVEGKGMSQPLNNNSSDKERALNRRVELTILHQEL